MRTEYPTTLPYLLALNDLEPDPLRQFLYGSGYLWNGTPVELVYTLVGSTDISTATVTGITLTATQLVLHGAAVTLSLGDISYLQLPNGLTYRRDPAFPNIP